MPEECSTPVKKVALYCRPSQAKKWSLEVQKKELLDYCAQRGYEVTKVLIDRGVEITKKEEVPEEWWEILEEQSIQSVVVLNKEVMERVRFHFLSLLLKAYGKEMEVVQEKKGDLRGTLEDLECVFAIARIMEVKIEGDNNERKKRRSSKK